MVIVLTAVLLSTATVACANNFISFNLIGHVLTNITQTSPYLDFLLQLMMHRLLLMWNFAKRLHRIKAAPLQWTN